MKQNKTVLITGATSGIGLELAKLFAKDNYNLIIVARSEQELAQTKTALGQLFTGNVIAIAKDLFRAEAAAELYAEVAQQRLKVDILVNNAGQGQYGEFVESDIERQLDIIQLNISSLVSLTYLYLKDFVARGEGKILNTSSIASKSPGPWQAVYHATKAFVQSFTEAIRSEVKDKGVTVTALLPGVTDTDFFNKADMNSSKAVQDKDKMADPADVAKDGYDALMNGDDMVVSGMSNKMQVAMGAITPDETMADVTNKKQEPVTKK
ncbi:MAG: Oxidoreductase [Flavipsychrobacter sp.]|nr:Oxidoreductase [Flavipsychrobacter sp.]